MMAQLMNVLYEVGFTNDSFKWVLSIATKGALVLLVTVGLSYGLRGSSAARRHLAWTVGAVTLLLIPVGAAFLPKVAVPVPAWISQAPSVAFNTGLQEGERRSWSPTRRATVVPSADRSTGGSSFGEGPSTEVHSQGPALPAQPASTTSPADGSTVLEPASPRWTLLWFGIWVGGLVGVLSSLMLATARTRWLETHATPVVSGPLYASLLKVANTMGVSRLPRLLQGDDWVIPMTWGIIRPRILLPVGAEAWAPWRIEAVLLHELGHIARRDCLAQAVAHVACAIHWFNPIAWYAARRMRVEREYACDDLVVSFGLERASYARDLVDLARALRPPQRATAALSLARPNNLRERLLALMDETRDRRQVSTTVTGVAVVLALALALPLAAATPQWGVPAEDGIGRFPSQSSSPARGASPWVDTPASSPGPLLPSPAFSGFDSRKSQEAISLCGPRDGEAKRQSHSTSDDVTSIEAEFGDCRSFVRIEGDIEFEQDFSSIVRLSSDGFLRLEVSRNNERRRLEVRPGTGGRPAFDWRVGGEDLPFDTVAEEWLEGALLDLFRSTSYKAEERTAWLLAQRGVGGVLSEVEQIWSGHVRSRYLTALLKGGNLTQPQIRSVFAAGGERIESDHALGDILATAAERYSFDTATQGAFLEAAETLQSDHQQARALGTMLSRDDLSPETLRTLLRSAREGLESDHQMAEILVGLAARYPLGTGTRGPFLDAASTLESDHQKGRVYGIVLGQPGLDPSELAAVLDAAATMESDHQLAELLRQAANQDLTDPTLRAAFLTAARSIESDHNRAQVLERALEMPGLRDEDFAEILSSASTIDSDHQLAQVLVRVADRRPSGIATRRSYLEAAASIEGDHNMAETLRAFVALEVAPAELTQAIDLAGRTMDSDHQLAELLLDISRAYPIEGQVREAFLRALDSIESKHQRGRVASEIVND